MGCMGNPSKAKGSKAEREVAALLTELTGVEHRRQLGAGRQDDVGDIDGIPGVVYQVADWQNVARAIREKPEGAERQRLNAKADLAVTALRLRGGVWRFVLTPDQFVAYLREAGRL